MLVIKSDQLGPQDRKLIQDTLTQAGITFKIKDNEVQSVRGGSWKNTLVGIPYDQPGVAEGRAGVDDTDTVGFSVNSEAAYMAVMKRFGDVIDHDETSGIMYAPAHLWPKIEMVAFDADGEGATQDDGINEAGSKRLKKSQFAPGREWQAPGYPERVAELEAEGLTTSDAQAVADAEVMSGNYTKWSNNLMPENSRNEMDTPEFQRALASLKKKAQQGPMKTVYDPRTGKYKVVPVKSKGE
jgi:hypothetical protein